MAVTYMEVRHIKREAQRRLALDKGLRDALADLCRRRWPSGTAKHAARAFRLTLDQGRSIVANRASLTTLEQAIKAGGWSLVFPLLGEVIGQSAEQYIIEARKANEERDQRLSSLAGNLWAVAPFAGPDPAHLDRGQGDDRPRRARRLG